MNPVLREARSSPYINIGASREGINSIGGSHDSICSGYALTDKQNQSAISDIDIKDFKMQFNMGSCNSVDMSSVMDSYNDSYDPEVLKNWMCLYEAQKFATSSFTDLPSRSSSKKFSESVDNLRKDNQTNASISSINIKEVEDHTNNRYSINHRSMDVLPTPKKGHHKENRILEKCCSVEFTNKMFPPARGVLKRSKEMSNIAEI